MTTPTTLDRIRSIILARRADLIADDVHADTVLAESPLSFDSLDLAEFVVALETEFEIIAVDQDFLGLRTIDDAATFVDRQRSGTDDRR